MESARSTMKSKGMSLKSANRRQILVNSTRDNLQQTSNEPYPSCEVGEDDDDDDHSFFITQNNYVKRNVSSDESEISEEMEYAFCEGNSWFENLNCDTIIKESCLKKSDSPLKEMNFEVTNIAASGEFPPFGLEDRTLKSVHINAKVKNRSAKKPCAENTENRFGDVIRQVSKKEATANKWKETFEMGVLSNPGLAHPISNSMAVEVALCEAAFKQNAELDYSQFDSFYGLPQKVKELLEKLKGIKNLYDWQEECLQLDAVLNRKNLIYSLPTSGGKTLVAEILIWKEVLCHDKDALLIVPYVSIVQEKIRMMNGFATEMHFNLEEYAGSRGQIPPMKRRKKHTVYIATIEKAHSLINSLVEQKRIQELGLVVVDELHMIGEDSGRGSVLECTLAKLQFTSATTMIIGMSATLGNLQDLKTFLNAEVYCREFRPVELNEYLKVGNDIYSVNSNAKTDEELLQWVRKLNYKYSKEMLLKDPDCLAGLVMEIVPQNSCLFFCPTKKNCENVALLLCSLMPVELLKVKPEEKKILLQYLKNEANGVICPILEKTIPFGVAYHHSGMTMDERLHIEEAYSSGILSCLTCTSTLAAGVNLPAKRVVIRSPFIGKEFLTHGKMKQMIGRAGRTGIDTSGESILIIKPGEEKMVFELLRNRVEECHSSLLKENGRGLKMLLLSAVGLQVVKTSAEAIQLVSKTLLNVQPHLYMDTPLEEHITGAMECLREVGLIKQVGSEEEVKRWEVSQLGRAAFKGAIDINYARRLYSDLKHALASIALNTPLHLLYLIIPYNMEETIRPIPQVYRDSYYKLSPVDLNVAELLGIGEITIIRIALGQKLKASEESNAQRFYITLILYDLWRQSSIWKVADKFHLPRGHVQNLLSSSTSFASCILHFCNELKELWAYQSLLPTFIQQLSYCVSVELLPLMELPYVQMGRARQLYNTGFKTINQIAQTDPEQLMKSVDNLPRRISREIVQAAKILLRKKAEDLQEEIDDLVSGL